MTDKKRKQHHFNQIHPLSHAMADLYRACLSFPTPGDVTWKMLNPHQRDPRARRKSH